MVESIASGQEIPLPGHHLLPPWSDLLLMKLVEHSVQSSKILAKVTLETRENMEDVPQSALGTAFKGAIAKTQEHPRSLAIGSKFQPLRMYCNTWLFRLSPAICFVVTPQSRNLELQLADRFSIPYSSSSVFYPLVTDLKALVT